MRITITHKLTITIIIFVILGGVVFFLLISPSVRSIREATRTIAERAQTEDEEFQRMRLLRRSFGEIGSIEEKINSLSKISISETDAEELIHQFELLAREHSVGEEVAASYHTFSSEEQEAHYGFPGSYTFTLSITGPLERVQAYFAAVESLPYYFSIPGVTIEKSTKTLDGTVLLSFNVTLFSSSAR